MTRTIGTAGPDGPTAGVARQRPSQRRAVGLTLVILLAGLVAGAPSVRAAVATGTPQVQDSGRAATTNPNGSETSNTPPGAAGAASTALGASRTFSTAPGSSGSGTVDTSSCAAPTLTQPFLSVHDHHFYTLMPGEKPGRFVGTGWTLTGGAKIVTAKLADGTTGPVLDLPTGGTAVSPTICVTSGFPSARTLVRDVTGHGAISFYMSLAGTRSWASPRSSGQRHGKHTSWTLTNRINLHPPHTRGWHLMRIKLVGRGKAAEVQLYNLWVDPRMMR